MLGIDLTKISRFKNVNKNFIKKILHEDELKSYEISIDKPKFLAVRWAIKEAIYKCDNKYSNFQEINILKDKIGRYIFLDFEISTSSEEDLVMAIVLKK